MEKQPVILITGAAGFIGSCLTQYLNEQGIENLILVDKFRHSEKEKNWKNKKYKHLVDRELLLEWIDENKPKIEFVIHLGARTDVESDQNVYQELNVEYSEDIWNYCTAYEIPLIYASSAATYGNGELGYDDDDNMLADLKPVSPYGTSKNEFDKWAVRQLNAPPFWAGLKFFNVYGPNEYHKKHKASMVYCACSQIESNGALKLNKNQHNDVDQRNQSLDFIYVKDVVKVIGWIYSTMKNNEWTTKNNGIYNVGTGMSRSYNDMVKAIFAALNKEPEITYTETPVQTDRVNNYQHFAQASIIKLKHAGYDEPFTSLEEGVDDYVKNYLSKKEYY